MNDVETVSDKMREVNVGGARDNCWVALKEENTNEA